MAERMPLEEPSLLARPLSAVARLVTRYPLPTVALAIAVALLSVALAGNRLGFRTSRLDLLNPESGYNRLWVEYINEFGEEDDAVVVVQGASRAEVVPVLHEVSQALTRESHLFNAVLHEVDLSRIRKKGLHYLEVEDLERIDTFLQEVGPVVQGDWARMNVGNMVAGLLMRMEAAPEPAEQRAAEEELARLMESLAASLNRRGEYVSPWPQMPHLVATLSELGSEYILTNEGRLGFVLLRLASSKTAFDQSTESIEALRRLIAQIQARHPDVRIGLTGLPVMENDEMQASQRAMAEATVLSLVGVALLFIAGFGGIRHPLMTVAALILGICWSLGFITVAIGHLNILSISFGAILVGLGIDFGIHLVSRYMQHRGQGQSAASALRTAVVAVGPGIVTGAVTTALAFFMAGFTEFTGVRELGWIAGGGVLLCCLAMIAVLPAMIHLSDAHRPLQHLPAPLDIRTWLTPLYAKPELVLVAAVAATVILGMGMTRLWYDHNLLNMQPEGLESVELERKLLAESDRSVWFALSIAESPEELLARAERFLQLESVERVEEIASMFPRDDGYKRPVIERIQARLANLPERPPRIPIDPPEDLGLLLAHAQGRLSQHPRAARLTRHLETIRGTLRTMSLAECYQGLSDYQHRMAGDLLSRLHSLHAMADPEPPQLTDLPEGLVTRFVGHGGRYLLKIYSRGSIWDMEAMETFVREVRSVDPRVTGNPLQTYEASREMKRSYERAAKYALAGVLLALFIDFVSFRHAAGRLLSLSHLALTLRDVLFAVLPLGLGMVQLFGIMGYLDIPLNPANMIVLPLILGIGIDYGVHVVHDFRRQRGRYRISPSTANAVFLTTLTTMVGFGSLMIASHRGLQSLGRVLTIGVCCCLFCSIVVLPAILTLLTRHRREADEEDRPAQRPTHMKRAFRHDTAHHRGTSQRALTPSSSGTAPATTPRG